MVARVTPLPNRGQVFFDERDPDRTMRVSWRPQEGVFVLSLWREAECTGTFRLPKEQLSGLMAAMVDQLTSGSHFRSAAG